MRESQAYEQAGKTVRARVKTVVTCWPRGRQLKVTIKDYGGTVVVVVIVTNGGNGGSCITAAVVTTIVVATTVMTMVPCLILRAHLWPASVGHV
jgi:hypothetical protein